ncbi:hypothetical protein GCM10025768_05020 [Microbacterium pseudoresistens]|uniref:Fatty acid desaturase n=1 Tax=Microbacterium pseudoresistens TaxID=640634 RepID=A0A7Y9JP53_9MICO|nr:phage holin family protein [Microbacterium pseudoresistens]NYD54339.1 fatty acid desaturase [Microbacterium pseudoresistens]
MTRGYRNRADDGLLTLLGDLPELTRNLVTAEVNAAKSWVSRTAKDAGVGSVWFVIALFFLFWAIPVLLVFAIAGISSWWPVWLSAIVVFAGLILVVLFFALLGLLKFRRVVQRDNPAEAVSTDIRLVKGAGHDDA